MILAVDVQYNSSEAHVGAVLFEAWDSEYYRSFSTHCSDIQEYESGEFYKRELPCLLKLIVPLLEKEKIDTIVVDGYVDLGEHVPGLGRHLFYALDEKVEVVGVAKTVYRGAPCLEVVRGTSEKPLLVSSTGNVYKAVDAVKSMAGSYRFPTQLMRADHVARGLSNV